MDLETLGKFRWIHSRFARQGRVPWKKPPAPRVYIIYIYMYRYIEIYTFCLNIEMSICLKTTQPCAKLWSWNRTSLGPEVSVCRFAERCLKEDEERGWEDMRKNGKKCMKIFMTCGFLIFVLFIETFTNQNLILHIFSPISLPSLIWKPTRRMHGRNRTFPWSTVAMMRCFHQRQQLPGSKRERRSGGLEGKCWEVQETWEFQEFNVQVVEGEYDIITRCFKNIFVKGLIPF